MKDLGLSWEELKLCTRAELHALLIGLNNYNVMHAFDGYTSKDIDAMAKDNSSIRGDYSRTQEMKARYGAHTTPTSFKEFMN